MLLVSLREQYNIGVFSAGKYVNYDFVLLPFLAGKIDGSRCSYGPIDLAINLYLFDNRIDQRHVDRSRACFWHGPDYG